MREKHRMAGLLSHVVRRTRKTSLAGAPNRRPSGMMRKGLPSGGSLLKNTAPPASPPGGAGTPLPIKPGSGVQTTYLEIRQERKSPGADTGALIRRPSRLPGAPYTARERLTAASSYLMGDAKRKTCMRISRDLNPPGLRLPGSPKLPGDPYSRAELA